MTTRERKIEWIDTFGRNALRDAVSEILAIDGHWFLTDEQIEQITSKMAYDAREKTRRMVRNRNIFREEAGLPPLVRGASLQAEERA
ncbi:hypothetical protein [Rhizobium ruizarguesonis]|uniref:hypothetical protein n=1 Tax=Rhizobium ruizarguesonis TaxID=2081791 RepID=UPI00102F9FEB|nr:hypothetical protein [Rhizobium ruizarguesonis]TBE67463.1 hypothetical protein ELH00_16495 [Rhizobium ruizarguesonis]